ncbi:MAG TPA: tRNA uridine-5-carboxymethylaminomethyl(34) synthesis GTPase MnmE, partial [Phaeodactylibacter sp.]|nr:tRNA uridine-5-carboxymethylaminomethyl(34) synthesis GTPase MnmE [Phaeodactylibacter sp.]
MTNLEDTIIALATPQPVGSNTGAIALIRMSGKGAIAIAQQCFYGKKLSKQPSHTLHFGTIKDEQKQPIDEVLLSVFRAPHSYTGEDAVEIS